MSTVFYVMGRTNYVYSLFITRYFVPILLQKKTRKWKFNEPQKMLNAKDEQRW